MKFTSVLALTATVVTAQESLTDRILPTDVPTATFLPPTGSPDTPSGFTESSGPLTSGTTTPSSSNSNGGGIVTTLSPNATDSGTSTTPGGTGSETTGTNTGGGGGGGGGGSSTSGGGGGGGSSSTAGAGAAIATGEARYIAPVLGIAAAVALL